MPNNDYWGPGSVGGDDREAWVWQLLNDQGEEVPEDLEPLIMNWEVRRQHLRYELSVDPLFKRYMSHLESHAPNAAPWTGLGNRAVVAWELATVPEIRRQDNPVFDVIGVPVDGIGDAVISSIAHMVRHTPPFLWTSDISHLVNEEPLPEHIVSPDVMPYPSMLWTYEAGRIIYSSRMMPEYRGGGRPENWDDPALQRPFENWWTFLFRMPDGVITWMMDAQEMEAPYRVRFLMGTIRPHTRYPDDFSGPGSAGSLILKGLAFMNSKYYEVAPHRLPRDIRREYTRKGRQDPSDEISVIVLRSYVKTEVGLVDPSKMQEHPGYSVKWWVRGHNRAQWYPSLKAHKVKYIEAYLKGNPNAPLKEKVYHVKQ